MEYEAHYVKRITTLVLQEPDIWIPPIFFTINEISSPFIFYTIFK